MPPPAMVASVAVDYGREQAAMMRYRVEGTARALTLGRDGLDDLERDVADLLDRAPVRKGADVDRHGRPALGVGCRAPNLSRVRPLSDPLGGARFANERTCV